MHIIIVAALLAAVLYFWIVGHWFARALMFLTLAGLFGFIGSILAIDNSSSAAATAAGVFGAVLGAVLAWFVAAIPTYFWRVKIQQLEARLREQCNANAAQQRWNPMSGRYEYR